VNYTYCEAYENETQWGILLGASVKAVKDFSWATQQKSK
jgi:hypothetical protein